MAVGTSTTVELAGEGHIWIAATHTARPADPAAPEVAWTEVGHTGRDDPLTISREGGDRATLGSWQEQSLRERIEPVTYMVGFTLLERDEDALKLYYGGGSVATGHFTVPTTPTAQEHALFVHVVDGALTWTRWFPKVSILGSDEETLSTEELTALPVQATVLTPNTVTLDGLFTVSVAA